MVNFAEKSLNPNLISLEKTFEPQNYRFLTEIPLIFIYPLKQQIIATPITFIPNPSVV